MKKKHKHPKKHKKNHKGYSDIETIFKAVHDMEDLEANDMDNRSFYKKVKDNVIDSDKKRYTILKHIIVKGFYTILIYFIINYLFSYFGLKITPEVKEGIDLVVDIVMP